MQSVTIFTDGSSRGNPGPGGFGVILQYRDSSGTLHEREISEGYEKTTNNRMELLGIITALESLKAPCDVTLYTDSQYAAKAFNEHWVEGWIRNGWKNSNKQPVKNEDLWQRLLAAKEPHHVEFHWVKGHAGHPENTRCDELATAAAAGEDLKRDKGFDEV